MIDVSVEAVTVRRNGVTLIDAVSFKAHGGEFIGLVGPNGAGKTTLLRAMAGLDESAEGDIRIGGASVRWLAARDRARRIAYLAQAREVAWAITADAVVALGRFAYGAPSRLSSDSRIAVDRALAATGAHEFRERTMPTLSGGEQARIHLARALAAETPILLADEPTAALDPKHQRAIMSALRMKADAGAIVIAALHDLRAAQRYCTRVIAMNAGRVVADDTPERALTSSLVERVFDMPAGDH
ncbi:MAG: ABC transporter ATP-binding protein [Parvularculaceae bacterium]|nr:ABC transporter ATP-binding protein [Parvularculaceae bacterium]